MLSEVRAAHSDQTRHRFHVNAVLDQVSSGWGRACWSDKRCAQSLPQLMRIKFRDLERGYFWTAVSDRSTAVDWPIIHKVAPATGTTLPNLGNYEQARKAFSWDQARNELAGLPDGGGINIAYEALDRHVREGRGDRVALRWLAKEGGTGDFSYTDLAELSSRFANALNDLGVQCGERVFALLGRVPALYVAAFGTWKHRAVLCPLFSAFGPEPIAARMAIAEPAVLVASAQLFRRKVMPILGQLPYLRHVILVDGLIAPMPAVPLAAGESPAPTAQSASETTETSDGRIVDFQELLDSASTEYTIGPTDPEDLATLHFTSGTTGRPKAAMHVHAGVAAHRATAMLALDLRPDDVYWCTADPGWVTWTSYGIIGPLAVGCTLIADEEEFDAERWYRTLAEQHVNVW